MHWKRDATPRHGGCRNEIGSSFLRFSLSSPPNSESARPARLAEARDAVYSKNSRGRERRSTDNRASRSNVRQSAEGPQCAPIDLILRTPSLGIAASGRRVVFSYPQFDPYSTKNESSGQVLFHRESTRRVQLCLSDDTCRTVTATSSGPLPADTAAPRHGSLEADRYFPVPIRKRAFSSSGDGWRPYSHSSNASACTMRAPFSGP